jgi:FKBP-type peptidyl-prolyl cis-trans isomerase FklB
MNRIFSALAIAVILAGGASAQEPAAPASSAPELKDLKSKISYLIGMNIGRQMKSENMDLDLQVFLAGMKDAMAGAKPALTEEQMQQVVQEFQAQGDAKMSAEAEKHKTEGAAFLAANGKKEGVITLPSGVQYKVVKSGDGTGAHPTLNDSVLAHYKGTLLDGSTFDSSYDRGQPASFGVGQVIAGWTEVLQKMKPGDKWEVFIPGEHAYGPQGRPGIPPNAMLTFTIELIAVQQQ